MQDQQFIGGPLDGRIASESNGLKPIPVCQRFGGIVGEYKPQCYEDIAGNRIVVYEWAANSAQPEHRR